MIFFNYFNGGLRGGGVCSGADLMFHLWRSPGLGGERGVGVGPGAVGAGVGVGGGVARGVAANLNQPWLSLKRSFFLPLLPLTTVTAPAVSV